MIISDINDTQIYWVTHYLKKWGVPYAQFNVAEYPLHVKHTSIWSKADHKEYFIDSQKHLTSIDKIKSVWYRKPDTPKFPAIISIYERNYGYNECQQDLYGLYSYLQDRFWISPIDNLRRASNKPLQLRLASKIGLTIPDTIITNIPEEAWKFSTDHGGNIIYKTLSDGLLASGRDACDQRSAVLGEIYTTPLRDYRLADFEEVSNCPCLFQEYIPKKIEIRVTIVKDRIFAAEIHSQENSVTKHDWRLGGDLKNINHRIHELPSNIIEKCIRLVERLGLNFGAIDMILTPGGEYVFLEINPNGQYGWIEYKTGLRISEAIAKTLVDGSKDFT